MRFAEGGNHLFLLSLQGHEKNFLSFSSEQAKSMS